MMRLATINTVIEPVNGFQPKTKLIATHITIT